MVSRRFSVWQKVVALAPLLLLAVYLPGQMMLRCRIDGLLRATCCCSHAKEGQESGPVAKAQDCCDQQMLAGERPVVEAARGSTSAVEGMSPAALPITAATFAIVVPGRPAGSWPAQGPPRDGPPLVLLKHAFLI